MKEISLEFSRQENDTTDLTAMVDGMGSCLRLQNIHIASVRLSHAVVLSLTAANLRFVESFGLQVHLIMYSLWIYRHCFALSRVIVVNWTCVQFSSNALFFSWVSAFGG